MQIQIQSLWLISMLLIAVRLAAMLWLTPLFTLGVVPARVRLTLVLVFSAAVAAVTPAVQAAAPATVPGWIESAVAELGIGLLMGFGIHCAFAAFSFGGRLLDMQMGFGVASLINPSNNEQEPLLGTLLLAVGVMTFFLLGGHSMIARSFLQSYAWFPLGGALGSLRMDSVVAQFGLMFSLGTILVAPVIVILLMIDCGLAMASKTMPQMNVFMISIPVKIAVGLLALAASASYLQGILRNIYQSVFDYWRSLVH